MDLPRFLLADSTELPDEMFVLHTEYPRFIINLVNDEIEWLEDFDKDDEEELLSEAEICIQEASEFYDKEVALYDE